MFGSTGMHLLRRACYSTIGSEPLTSVIQILEKKPINHDCYIYRLKFIDNPFTLNIGQHLRIIETIKTYDSEEGEEVVRKYTPISPCSQQVHPSTVRM